MKKLFCWTSVLLLFFTGCAGSPSQNDDKNPSNDASPPITTAEEYCQANADADLFEADDNHFYVLAEANWVVELDMTDVTPIGAIKNHGITQSFEAWDATKLPVGTELARHNTEQTVIIAYLDGETVPYLQYAG